MFKTFSVIATLVFIGFYSRLYFFFLDKILPINVIKCYEAFSKLDTKKIIPTLEKTPNSINTAVLNFPSLYTDYLFNIDREDFLNSQSFKIMEKNMNMLLKGYEFSYAAFQQFHSIRLDHQYTKSSGLAVLISIYSILLSKLIFFVSWIHIFISYFKQINPGLTDISQHQNFTPFLQLPVSIDYPYNSNICTRTDWMRNSRKQPHNIENIGLKQRTVCDLDNIQHSAKIDTNNLFLNIIQNYYNLEAADLTEKTTSRVPFRMESTIYSTITATPAATSCWPQTSSSYSEVR